MQQNGILKQSGILKFTPDKANFKTKFTGRKKVTAH